jgi:hypothetical protein
MKFNISMGQLRSSSGNTQSKSHSGNLGAETQATFDAIHKCGLEVPGDITGSTLLAGFGRAFLPGELPPASYLPDIGSATKQYLDRIAQPNLVRGAQRGDEKVFQLAHQIGRLMSVGYNSGQLMTLHPPLKINKSEISVDGKITDFDPINGKVVEVGMGINGLASHLSNVRRGLYTVTGVHRSATEATLLRGFTEHQAIGEDALEITEDGIGKAFNSLSELSKEEKADLIVISRAHPAGRELRFGLMRVGSILRDSGIIVARGPKTYKQGMGYKDVFNVMNRNPSLNVTMNYDYLLPLPSNGMPEPNKLIIAEKILG